ncbi:MAG: hypothetical protein U1C53_02020, partial [Candidatus Veblenbacteria bacterium]|nr:hypothetical protein [Candidatus Veblenbacteria bacterium]
PNQPSRRGGKKSLRDAQEETFYFIQEREAINPKSKAQITNQFQMLMLFYPRCHAGPRIGYEGKL